MFFSLAVIDSGSDSSRIELPVLKTMRSLLLFGPLTNVPHLESDTLVFDLCFIDRNFALISSDDSGQPFTNAG